MPTASLTSARATRLPRQVLIKSDHLENLLLMLLDVSEAQVRASHPHPLRTAHDLARLVSLRRAFPTS